MAIDMTNATYEIRYFLNDNPSRHKEHCFYFGKKKPLIPQVGDRVILNYIIDDYYPYDDYDNMPQHWYKVTCITYGMDDIEDYPVVMIDINAVDVTDEVMDECASVDEGCCCPHCGEGC